MRNTAPQTTSTPVNIAKSQTIYDNNWANVREYVYLLCKQYYPEFLNKLSTLAKSPVTSTDQEKISELRKAVAEYLKNYPPGLYFSDAKKERTILIKILNFIASQKQQAEEAKLMSLFIKNSFSANKALKTNYITHLNTILNTLPPEKSAPIVEAFLQNKNNHSGYRRFSNTITNLTACLFKNNKLNQTSSVDHTQPLYAEWKEIQDTIRLNMSACTTNQKTLRDKLYRKMMKIALSGASSKSKHAALEEFISKAREEYAAFWTLSNTLKTIYETIYKIEYSDTAQKNIVTVKM